MSQLLDWKYGVDGNGMLYAVYQDALNNGTPYEVKLDGIRQILELGDGVFAVMNDEFGSNDNMEITVQNNSMQ